MAGAFGNHERRVGRDVAESGLRINVGVQIGGNPQGNITEA